MREVGFQRPGRSCTAMNTTMRFDILNVEAQS
jgi:hypothetical protein